MINLFILVILKIFLIHLSFASIDVKNGTILQNGDVFVLTVRSANQAGYALIPKDVARNFTNQTDFSVYFMDTKVDAGNFFAVISPVIIGNNSRIVGNVTLFPHKIVERSSSGGGEGSVINVDFHEQGWYKMNTGSLQLPSDFGSLSPDLVNKNVTIAQAKYISNTTDSQNRNTTVQVTAIFLPDLVLENQNAISIALLFTVSNFPFKFNSSILSMVNSLSSYINATNTTIDMPVADFFGFGNSSLNGGNNVKTIKNGTRNAPNNTVIYFTEQDVESAGRSRDQNDVNVNILEAFLLRREPFDNALKNEQKPVNNGSLKVTPSTVLHFILFLVFLGFVLS